MHAIKSKVNCPVCGMDVDQDSRINAEYKGQTYYFCTDADRKEFMKHPQVYAGMEKISKAHKVA